MRITHARSMMYFSHEVGPVFELGKSHKVCLRHTSVLTVHTIYCKFNGFKSNLHHDLMMLYVADEP